MVDRLVVDVRYVRTAKMIVHPAISTTIKAGARDAKLPLPRSLKHVVMTMLSRKLLSRMLSRMLTRMLMRIPMLL